MITFNECQVSGYGYRTMMNIINSDITIAIAKNFNSAGELLTKKLCLQNQKPIFQISYDDCNNDDIINEIRNNILNFSNHSMSMNFSDGYGNRKMRNEFKNCSTIDLIIDNKRFATTREKFYGIKKNNIVQFYSKDKKVFVRITSNPYHLKDIIPYKRTYNGFIEKLNENEIFVFGSNTEGRHMAGAAKKALEFGAVYGQASGLQGNTYAIITKDLNIGKRSISEPMIINQICDLYKFANENPEKDFLIAYKNDNNNLNGYTSNEMARMFIYAIYRNNNIPINVIFEEGFFDLIRAEYWSILECWVPEMYYGLKEKQQIRFTKNFDYHINIAGNGIQTLNTFGITQEQCDEKIYNFLSKLNIQNLTILSGGQTGVDESAIKAANNLNLNSKIYAPKGWKFRDKMGNDIYNEVSFKHRFFKNKLLSELKKTMTNF